MGREQLPAHIRNERGALMRKVGAEVRRQPELAAALLAGSSFDDIRDWVLSHRERPDGTGYPRGLRGQEIFLEARILAVVEAYAAMTSDRPYRAARDHEDAILELIPCGGQQFDAAVVDAFE